MRHILNDLLIFGKLQPFSKLHKIIFIENPFYLSVQFKPWRTTNSPTIVITNQHEKWSTKEEKDEKIHETKKITVFSKITHEMTLRRSENL